MGNKLFVGSLPFETTEDQLHDMFTPFGQVTSAKLISDKFTSRSKGFGFVEMANDAEAQAAIQKMNGSTVGSRQIVVNEARPMEKREGGFRGGFGGRGGSGGGGGRGSKGGRGGSGGGFNRW